VPRTPCHSLLLALSLTALLGALQGCGGGHAVAPLGPRQTQAARTTQPQYPARRAKGPTYTVRRGDTLYSIAWRFSLDHRTLASHNRIPAPFTIYPKQVIRVDVAARKPQPRTAVASSKTSTATKVRKTQPSSTTIIRADWRWPASGPTIEKYSKAPGGNKGIDISGRRGAKITAAAAGKVVYAGSGLRQYGNLIIIKHSAIYLSAYAHNHVLAVKEGENVKRGQKIASMGSSGTDRVKLHFEIRKRGSTINPLLLLPKKR